MCPRTQPDVPQIDVSTYSAHVPMDRCVYVLSPMYPWTDVSTYSAHVSTDRCVHVLSPMCLRTDVSTYSVRGCPRTDVSTYSPLCAYGLICPRTQPYVPTDRCVHVLSPMYPRTDVSTYSDRCGHDRCVHVLGLMCPRTDVPTDRTFSGLRLVRVRLGLVRVRSVGVRLG